MLVLNRKGDQLIGSAGKMRNKQYQTFMHANSPAFFPEMPKGSWGELCRFASPAEGTTPTPGGGSELPQASAPDGSERQENAPGWRENAVCRAGRVAALARLSGHRRVPRWCPSQNTGGAPGCLSCTLTWSAQGMRCPRLLHVPRRCWGSVGRVGLVLRLADRGLCGDLLPADYSHHHRLRGQVPTDLERAAAGSYVHAHWRLLLRPSCRKRRLQRLAGGVWGG